MSGLEVLGGISAIIAILDACVSLYKGARKDLRLPKTFTVVTQRLPVICDTLRTCKISLEPQRTAFPDDVWQALEDLLESCEDKARDLRTIFEKVIVGENAGWESRYKKIVQRLGKGSKVEDLMTALTEDVQHLVNHNVLRAVQPESNQHSQTKQLDQILQELQSLQASLIANAGSSHVSTNTQGMQNINTGSGVQINYGHMSGIQNFYLEIKEKDRFGFSKSAGVLLYQAPVIDHSLFIGRSTELDQMAKCLNPGGDNPEQHRLVLGGMGGVGKTQLAIAFAQRKSNVYKSIFWLNATSEATLKASFQAMAEGIFDLQDHLSLGSDQLLIHIKRWLSATNNPSWLLIFDNYDEPDAYDIEEYYPYAAHGSIIVTTRLPDQVGGAKIHVKSFEDVDQSLQILASRCKRPGVLKDLSARRLAQRLAGFPLALTSAAVFLEKSTWTFERYLQEYESRWNISPQRELKLQEYRDRTFYTTWNISYQRLTTESNIAAEFLKLLAYFDHQALWFELFHAGSQDDLPQWLRNTITDSVRFENIMQVLVEYCFVEVNAKTGSYSLHSCVHDWIYACLNENVDTQKHRYALDCISRSIGEDYQLYVLLTNARYVPHALRLLYGNFNTLYLEIACTSYYDASIIVQLLHKQNQLPAAQQTLQQILEVYSERFIPTATFTLEALTDLGNLYFDEKNLSEAEKIYTRVLAGYERELDSDDTLVLGLTSNLGNIYYEQEKLEQCERTYLRALHGFRKNLGSGDDQVSSILHSLANLYTHQKRYDEAEDAASQALEGFEHSLGPDHVNTLRATYNLCGIYCDQHKFDLARKMGRRAVEGYEKTIGPDSLESLHCVMELARACSNDRAFWNEAMSLYARAAQTSEQLLGPSNEATQICRSGYHELLAKKNQSGRAKLSIRLLKPAKSSSTPPTSKSSRLRSLISRSRS